VNAERRGGRAGLYMQPLCKAVETRTLERIDWTRWKSSHYLRLAERYMVKIPKWTVPDENVP
jgi:hypothetical protein